MITVHCGLHKTGSSSIQVALSLFASSTRRLVIVPDHRDDPTESGWAKRLRALTASPNAIFSDENLLGDPRDGYAMAPQRVAMLRDILQRTPFQLIVYLRPQLDWLGSVYLQGIQEGRTEGTEEFLAGIVEQPFLDWSRLVSLLEDNSGAERVVVRAYGASRDAVEDFFEASGLGPPLRASRTAGRDNISISPLQAPILRALNADGMLTREQRMRLRSAFQGLLVPTISVPLSPFPEDSQQDLAGRFLDSWLSTAGMLRASDPLEAAVFRTLGRQWGEQLKPFPGASVTDPRISAEMLRCLRVTLDEVDDLPSSGRWERAWAKLRDNPRDFPSALRRGLRHLP